MVTARLPGTVADAHSTATAAPDPAPAPVWRPDDEPSGWRSWAGRVVHHPVVLRLAQVPVVAFVVTIIVFLVAHLLPGDPVTQLTANVNGITPEEVAQLTSQLGLDAGLADQLRSYLVGLLHGQMGISFYSGASVSSMLADALPATVELAVAAVLLAGLLGIVTGIVAARTQGTWVDHLIRGGATIGFSVPWFVVALVAILVFGVWLGWLPILGRLPTSLTYEPTTGFVLVDAVLQGRPDLIGPWLEHLALPALTLAVTSAGFITRVTRTAFLDAQAQQWVRTARMKGLTESAISVKHVLRNASVPILTIVGLMFGGLLGGAVVTEAVFSYPGVGSLLVEAVTRRDYFVLQGSALVIALMFTGVNALVDLSVLAVDPRLRRG
ncbi:ABC transporter permease [Cellulomonas citrea]|uniref:ABC transporter permease n=1 Tax=Cellulomonas citrea TaxID=1909423 RepID=UPI0013596825|nr:ABC transporter permease [Cellulomonas citrea]